MLRRNINILKIWPQEFLYCTFSWFLLTKELYRKTLRRFSFSQMHFWWTGGTETPIQNSSARRIDKKRSQIWFHRAAGETICQTMLWIDSIFQNFQWSVFYLIHEKHNYCKRITIFCIKCESFLVKSAWWKLAEKLFEWRLSYLSLDCSTDSAATSTKTTCWARWIFHLFKSPPVEEKQSWLNIREIFTFSGSQIEAGISLFDISIE